MKHRSKQCESYQYSDLTLIGIALAFLLAVSFQLHAFGQELTSSQATNENVALRSLKLSLLDAIELARRNYPLIRAALFNRDAAAFGVEKARTAYLPKGNLLVQATRATSNNITGPIFPNLVVPNISGGVKGNKNDMVGGWGSAFGTLISWEPFDFGLRKAKVQVANFQSKEARAQLAVTELDVVSSAADTFLRTLAAQELVRAAQAKLSRMKIFADTVYVLASKDLRPTTDEYLAQAEVAKAQDELTDAEQNFDLASAALGRAIGMINSPLNINPGVLLEKEPDTRLGEVNLLAHPLALSQEAAFEVSHARKKVIEKTYYPQFNFLGAVFARGSSFRTDVSIDQSKGYYPQKFNYAAGMNITFPYLDVFELHAEHKIAERLEQKEKANYDLILLNLQTQNAEARILIKGAIKIAENAPLRVKAASEAERSLRIRYQYGLATVNDVAAAEQLLTQSQVDYATAQLRVWQALLRASVAQGDIKPFVEQVSKLSTPGR